MTASRDGGLQNLEVHGMMTLRINDESKGRVKVLLHQGDMKNIQLQVGIWRDASTYNCIKYLGKYVWDGEVFIAYAVGNSRYPLTVFWNDLPFFLKDNHLVL